jgi:hypothetical protein
MEPRRNRVIVAAQLLAIGAAGGAATAWAIDPARHLPADGVTVVVSDQCGKSMSILAELEARADLRELVVPLPARTEDASFERACPIALQRLHNQAPLTRWLPDEVTCRRLVGVAQQRLRAGSGVLPSWYVGTHERMGADRDTMLEGHGLRLEPTALGLRLRRTTDPVDEVGVREQPATRKAGWAMEWRGLPIGW